MAKEHVHDVFESIAHQYDAANNRISLGMHSAWKRRLENIAYTACKSAGYWCNEQAGGKHSAGYAGFARKSSANSAGKHSASSAEEPRIGLVLDVCCGTGDITEHIARKHQDILVVGLDFSEKMLEVATQRTVNLNNVLLVNGNAMQLPFDDNTFDAAVISFGLRNTPDYRAVLQQMKRVTHAGGVVACLDASVPENKFVRPFYQFYYKHIMTLLGGGKSLHKQYEWLYESTQGFLSKQDLANLFENIGLEQVSFDSFMCGSAALHMGTVPEDDVVLQARC